MADIVIARMPRRYDYYDIDEQEDMWAGYMGAYSERAGLAVQFLDYMLNPSWKLDVNLVLKERPVLVGFALYQPTFNLYRTLKFIRDLRQAAGDQKFHVTLFGDSQIGVDKILAMGGVDSILIGEEAEFVELARRLKAGDDPWSTPGICYKDPATGHLRYNDALPLNRDLDSMPYPRRYFLDQLRAEGRLGPASKTSLLASRGCYAKCSFCHVQAYEEFYEAYPWRGRSPASIVAEMEAVFKEYGVRLFDFADLNFFGPGKKGRQRVQEFAELLISRGSPFRFSFYTRANDLDYDILALLKRAGLTSIFMGVESFSQSVLDRLHKGMTVEQNIRAIELCKELDVFIRMGFIGYDRFTTFDEIRQNIKVLREVHRTKPHLLIHPQFAFRPLALLDGTPIYTEYSGQGVLVDELAYDFPNFFAVEHPRFSLPGSLYDFENPLLPYLCEMTRVMEFEYEAKYTQVQKLLRERLEAARTESEGTEARRRVAECLSWTYNCPLFILDHWELAVEMLEQAGDPKEAVPRFAEQMFADFEAYNERYFGQALCGVESRWHYQKVQQERIGVKAQ